MNRSFKFVCSCIAAAALGACGGGGGDDSSVGAHNYSQVDVKNVAGLGALVLEITNSRAVFGMSFLGGSVAALATANAAGVQTVPLACGSGTGSAKVTKPAAHAGLKQDDEVLLTYDRCAGANGILLNGTAKLTLKDAASVASSGDLSASFKADVTDFDVTTNGSTLRYGGQFDFAFSTTDSLNVSGGSFTVPSGQALIVKAMSGSASAFTMTYGAGLKFEAADVGAPNSATRKFNGPVVAAIPAYPSGTLTFATPTVLTGVRVAEGSNVSFSPRAGVLNVSLASQGTQTLATSSTVNGSGVTVSGDSDGNGSLDLVFNTTWQALQTP